MTYHKLTNYQMAAYKRLGSKIVTAHENGTSVEIMRRLVAIGYAEECEPRSETLPPAHRFTFRKSPPPIQPKGCKE